MHNPAMFRKPNPDKKQLELRERNVAHLWADKRVLRFFRHNLDKLRYKRTRDVYVALCEIDSDFTEERSSQSAVIHAIVKTCSTYAGMDMNNVVRVMRDLKQWGLIDYGRKRYPKTQEVIGSFLTIYKYELWHNNFIVEKLNAEKDKDEKDKDGETHIRKNPNMEKPHLIKNGYRGNKNPRSTEILDTKVSIKDTGVSSNNSEPLNSSPPNIPPDEPIPEFTRKEKPPAKVHISPGSFTYRAVEEWNKLPGVNHHSDMTTKTAEKIARYIPQLIKGTFFIRNRFATDFIEKRIPAQWSNNGYKFTEQQILEAIKLSGRFLINGYFPPEKNNVPKSLSEMIYNPRSGTSWLLWALAHPPQPEKGNGNGGRPDEIPAIEDMLNRKLTDREHENISRNMKAMREYWEKDVTESKYERDGKTCYFDDKWKAWIAGYIRYLQYSDWDITPPFFRPDHWAFVKWMEE